MNRTKALNKTSAYKGVSFVPNRNVWEANIEFNNVKYVMGHVDVEEDAARAYNDKAIELFGKCASLNLLPNFDVRMFC